MTISFKYWQVWQVHYNPSFYRLVKEFARHSDALRYVQDYDREYWDEDNGYMGLVASPVLRTIGRLD